MGGKEQAQAVNRASGALVDVMIGNEEDFSAALGFDSRSMDDSISRTSTWPRFKQNDRAGGPGVLRSRWWPRHCAKPARPHERLGRHLLLRTGRFYEATEREDLEIFDRVGGGDSFASGLIYGFLSGQGPSGRWSAAPRMARWP